MATRFAPSEPGGTYHKQLPISLHVPCLRVPKCNCSLTLSGVDSTCAPYCGPKVTSPDQQRLRPTGSRGLQRGHELRDGAANGSKRQRQLPGHCRHGPGTLLLQLTTTCHPAITAQRANPTRSSLAAWFTSVNKASFSICHKACSRVFATIFSRTAVQAEVDGSNENGFGEQNPSLNTTRLMAQHAAGRRLVSHNGDISYARCSACPHPRLLCLANRLA